MSRESIKDAQVEPAFEQAAALRTAGVSNVVHVTVPAEVAFNLDKFQKVQADIFGRLGHPNCYSGWDVRWDLVRQFAVDRDLNVRQAGLVG